MSSMPQVEFQTFCTSICCIELYVEHHVMYCMQKTINIVNTCDTSDTIVILNDDVF